MAVTLLVNILVFVFLDPILTFMHVPDKVRPDMKIYLEIIFVGLIATSLYNYCSCMLRALGNSLAPLVFLGISSVVNIGLDLLFIAVFRMGVKGAAAATVIAQYISAVGILLYTIMKCREFLPGRNDRHYNPGILKEITKMIIAHLRPAVGHEFRHTHGAGTCKQLRAGNDGSFCRRSQD